MLCNYDKCPNEKNNECPQCMSGIMVLIGIISGIVAAAAGVLLFVNEILTAPFTAALAALITSTVFLFTIIIASAVSKCGSKIKSCIKCNKGGLFFGIFGTILSSLIAISVTLTAGIHALYCKMHLRLRLISSKSCFSDTFFSEKRLFFD